MLTLSETTRFLSKVDHPNINGCMLWKGGKDTKGYGKFWLYGSMKQAHRVAYEIAFGKFNRSLLVLHKCDVPSCVNPHHLKLGTYKDNEADKFDRKRNPPNKKVTEGIYNSILALHEFGFSQREIADELALDQSHISKILSKQYRWLKENTT